MTVTADTGQTATAVLSAGVLGSARRSIGELTQEIEKIEDSHLATTNYKTYIASDLCEPGETEIEVEWDINEEGPRPGAATLTLTISYPIEPGSSNTTKATLAGTGFILRRVTPAIALGTLMIGRFVFAFDGKTGPTWTDESA